MKRGQIKLRAEIVQSKKSQMCSVFFFLLKVYRDSYLTFQSSSVFVLVSLGLLWSGTKESFSRIYNLLNQIMA